MRGKRTSDEDKERVRAVLYVAPDASEREIAAQTGLSKSTVHEIRPHILEADGDTFDRLRAQKKAEFIESAWRVVGKALTLAEKRFDKALDKEAEFDALLDAIGDEDMTAAQRKALLSRLQAIEMANIRDVAIALGTIYDKQALASGEPTTISERREPTPELVQEMEAKLTKLKQLTG